ATMAESTVRTLKTWSDGQTVDVAHETTRITMAVAGKTLFDADTFSEADELGAALTTALSWAGSQASSLLLILQGRLRTGLLLLADELPDRLAAPCRRSAEALIPPILLPTRETRELRRALTVLEDRVARMIAERRACTQPRRDLLTLLLEAR